MTNQEHALKYFPNAKLVEVEGQYVIQLDDQTATYPQPSESQAWSAAASRAWSIQYQQEQEQRRALLRRKVLAIFQANPGLVATAEFEGGGDDGSVHTVDTNLEFEEDYDLIDAVTELAWDTLSETHGGWYNGAGGSGTVTISLVDGQIKAVIDMGWYVESQDWQKSEIVYG